VGRVGVYPGRRIETKNEQPFTEKRDLGGVYLRGGRGT